MTKTNFFTIWILVFVELLILILHQWNNIINLFYKKERGIENVKEKKEKISDWWINPKLRKKLLEELKKIEEFSYTGDYNYSKEKSLDHANNFKKIIEKSNPSFISENTRKELREIIKEIIEFLEEGERVSKDIEAVEFFLTIREERDYEYDDKENFTKKNKFEKNDFLERPEWIESEKEKSENRRSRLVTIFFIIILIILYLFFSN